jgi:hypothetical protein
MKKSRALLSACQSIAVAAALLAIASCAVPEPPTASGRVPLTDRAFVIASSGTVDIFGTAGWVPLSAGDDLEFGDRIRTGADSTVSIQFGRGAVMRLAERSEIEVRTLRYSNGETVLGFLLTEGQAFNDVRETASNTSFKVRTPQLVINSEGTRFSVLSTEGESDVGVDEGTVSVLALGEDPAELRRLTADPEILDSLDVLERTALRLSANEQLTVRDADVRDATSVFRDVRRHLLEPVEGENQRAAEPESLSVLIRYTADKIAEQDPQLRPLDEFIRNELESVRQTELLPLAEGEAENLTETGLARLIVRTDPADAGVYLNGIYVGNVLYSGIFRPDETVTLRVTHPGYRTEEREVEFRENEDRIIEIALQRIEPAVTADEFLDAVSAGRSETAIDYIRAGGSLDVEDQAGHNPVELAFGLPQLGFQTISRFSPQREIFSALLEAGVDPDTPIEFENRQMTPLFFLTLHALLASETEYELMRELLRAGASTEVHVSTGSLRVTPLAAAIIVGTENGNVPLGLIDFLLANGADPNEAVIYDSRIMTPIVAAVVVGAEADFVSLPLVERLLEAGANLYEKILIDGRIGNPLTLARRYGLSDVAEVIESYAPGSSD